MQNSGRSRRVANHCGFWAGSAGYELDVQRVDDTRDFSSRNIAATILELTGSNDAEVDVIESLAQGRAGKVIAVTSLDGKTVASLRRLSEANGMPLLAHLTDLARLEAVRNAAG